MLLGFNSVDQFGYNGDLYYAELPIHEHGMSAFI